MNDEPTQLDRIERKLDQLLNTRLRSRVGPAVPTREWKEADRKRHQRLFLLPESPGDKPKASRWKIVAATIGLVLGFAAIVVGSWWLWGVFIRMHC